MLLKRAIFIGFILLLNRRVQIEVTGKLERYMDGESTVIHSVAFLHIIVYQWGSASFGGVATPEWSPWKP
jgi:hypothetical protein